MVIKIFSGALKYIGAKSTHLSKRIYHKPWVTRITFNWGWISIWHTKSGCWVNLLRVKKAA